MSHELFKVGDCRECGEAVASDDGSPSGILVQRHRDGEVEVSHLSCVAKELGVSEQKADEYRPLCYMSDGQAANYIDGLMEETFERSSGFLSPETFASSLNAARRLK